MDKLVVTGGARLSGTVEASGSKNAALPMMVAALLAPEVSRFHHVPHLRDINTLARLIGVLGPSVHREGDTLLVDARTLSSTEAPYDLVKTMRASIYVLGPLLAREGRARVSLPGGCAWGPRPVNLHLSGMEALGATVEIERGYILAEARHGLRGADIDLEVPSVGATGNLMLAAVGAQGTTRIRNAAREPEMPALAACLESMGARITGAGTSEIVIEGGASLGPAEITVVPDRIEVGTFLVGAAMTAGDVTVTGCEPAHLGALLAVLRETGATVDEGTNSIRVRGRKRPGRFRLDTDFYPGFPTDLQAQMMALAAIADGESVITERVYHDRFTHVAELARLGAEITVNGNVATVRGVDSLSGARVMATDLRASAALILAGLAARGETHVSRVYHIDRGYERIEEKLARLAGTVRRENEPLVT